MSNNSTESEDIGNMIKRRMESIHTITQARARVRAIRDSTRMCREDKREAINAILKELGILDSNGK